MSWPREDLEEMARQAAFHHGIDPRLLAALVAQESSWSAWAWNPEPRYRWLWDVRLNAPFRPITPEERSSERPPPDFPALAGDPDQEWWAQQASWGLMQVMGAVARECGFDGPYLPAILEPATNLRVGCVHLKRKLRQSGGNVYQALLAWNGGGNPAYPQQVMIRMA